MAENDKLGNSGQKTAASPENTGVAMQNAETSPQRDAFTFRRMSGLDQAILDTDWEWRHLANLDQKLWMAMSCPTKGLEFNAATLELLDPDKDGRIRSADILDAVAWVCERVKHPSQLKKGEKALGLGNLRDDTDAGKEIIAAFELVAEKSGSENGKSVTTDEIDAVLAEAEGYAFNGDGVVPLSSVPEDEKTVYDFIHTAFEVVGAMRDASGKPGLDVNLAKEFEKRLSETKDFRKRLAGAKLPLGEKTAAGWSLLTRLGPKIDDYFSRCRMVEYAPGTLAAVNEENALANAGLGGEVISPDKGGEIIRENIADTLIKMPLARVEAQKPLPLNIGINPAWLGDMKEFRDLFAPLLGKGVESLSEETWKEIKSGFDSYAGALKSKPVYELPPADATRVDLPPCPLLALAPANDSLERAYMAVEPNAALDTLNDGQIENLLAASVQNDFQVLVEKDLAAPKMTAIQDLRKLSLFNTNLYILLMNFVSFVDFYEPDKKAIFQAGTLYLDSRACYLCVPVDDLETHVKLSGQSHLCLIYCQCQRTEKDGAVSSGIIVAALTGGDLVSLIEGRHGLFVDNEGKEWDSKIIKIVHNPISLREAVWAPYVRVSNMISEQAHKFLASREEAGGKAAENAANAAATPPKPEEPKPSFDFAKGAGIFAAVSVALSVLSAAFAYIANSLASLGWWWPLALIGIIICISGPSVIIAWFKLRRRSLGPLLDASGWAVNQGAPINMVMGHSLTSIGKMPKDAIRNLNDPYSMTARMRKTRNRIIFWFWFIILLAALIAGFIIYCKWWGLPAWLVTLAQNCGLPVK